MTQFSDLGLAGPLLRALGEIGHDTPTPIQAQAIPPVLSGRDLVGIAQTGTGKTGAFALPILHRLASSPAKPLRTAVRALVLAPTRELAGQIVDSARRYGRHLRPNVALAIGGVSIGPQIRSLAHGADILVATPGRLIDLLEQRAVRLDHVEVLVLDEADQMLDMGFIHAIRAILARLPATRQSLLFSATMPKEIEALAAKFLRDPVRVAVTPVARTADRVEQRVVHVDRGAKPAMLAEFLQSEPVDRALVFTRTKHGADKVVRSLEKAGIASAAIHGNKSQNQRERTLAGFRDGRVRTLVATDIAARGIDVAGVSHVFNFDLPNIPESYVHRIGRTARAGAAGIAISFCDADERTFLADIEKLIRMAIPATDRRTGRAHPAPGGDQLAPARPHAPVGKRTPGDKRRRRNGAPAGGKPEAAVAKDRHGQRPAAHKPQGERHGAVASGRTADSGVAGLNFMRPVRRPQAGRRAGGAGPAR